VAEGSGKAFGRYLRTLRERRGLSLDDVRSLSQTFPETLTKSYLSRCEHGHHKVALAKLIPLSRIYEVPAEALLERIELDLELDRLGGPETEGKSFAELADAAKDMSERGFQWEAYACARDAVARAPLSPVRDRYRDLAEQVAVATLNAATMAGGLGRNRFALHESLCVLHSKSVTAINHARVCDRIATIYRKLRQLDLAEEFAVQAISGAEASDDRVGLAYMYGTRARIAAVRPDPRAAVIFLHKSYSLHREAGHLENMAIALVSIAECYLDMRRIRSARRASEAALRSLADHPRSHARAAALSVMGKVMEAEGRFDYAISVWHEAASLARDYKDRVLRFKIDLSLLRRAMSSDDEPSARAIRRRLRKLAPWIPQEVEELTQYRDLVRSETQGSADSVATLQRGVFPDCN